METYRKIVIIIAIIVSIFLFVFFLSLPLPRMAITNPVTEEEFEYLRNKALKFAKSLDTRILNDKDLSAEYNFSDKELIVVIDSSRAKVTARTPISNLQFEIEDDCLKTMVKLEFEKTEFEEIKNLMPWPWYIMMGCLVSSWTGVIIYILFYKAKIRIKECKFV